MDAGAERRRTSSKSTPASLRSVSCGRDCRNTRSASTETGEAQDIQTRGKPARFLATLELVNALEQEKVPGKPGQRTYHLMYADLVIPDGLGYPPFNQAGGRDCSTCSPSSTNATMWSSAQTEALPSGRGYSATPR